MVGIWIYVFGVDLFFGVLLILENAIVAVLVYAYLHVKMQKKLEIAQQEVLSAIDEFSLDSTEPFVVNGTVDKFTETYRAIEKLQANLRNREKMREEVLQLVNTAASNMELSAMIAEFIPKIAEATSSEWGAFYQLNHTTNKLELKYSLGFSRNIYSEYDMSIGEGFVGKAAVTKRVQILKDIPDDTIYITRTVLGKIKPKNLMTVPVINQDKILGVIVLASIYEYTNYNTQLMEFVNHYLGLTIGNGITYERTKRLTNELQFQNKLILNLNEELEDKVRERTTFLNSVINSIQDYAIYSIDLHGYITTWNRCAERIFDFSTEEVLGEHINMIYSDEDVKSGKINSMIEAVKESGRYSEKERRVRRDGSQHYIEFVLFAMYDNEAEMIGFTNVSWDITQRKIHQEE